MKTLLALFFVCRAYSQAFAQAEQWPPPLLPAFDDCSSGLKGLWIDGLHVFSCSGDSLLLKPGVLIDGQWQTPAAGNCAVNGQLLTCGLGQNGTLYLSTANGVRMFFTANRPLVLGGMALSGELRLNGATSWLSNGFQSWSQTGVVSIKEPPSGADLQAQVMQNGEDEVYRKGRDLSWWYTYAGGGHGAFVAGASTAEIFKSWIHISKTGESGVLQTQLVSGAAGEALALTAGQTLHGETWHISLGDFLRTALERYSATLDSRHLRQPPPPLFGWNSWYNLWDGVTEAQVMDNAAALQQRLIARVPQQTGPAYVVVDDGWEKAWGDWDTNDKFPSGLAGMAKHLKDQGLETGLWIAPVMVAPNTPLAQQHPEWLVKDLDYQHPSGSYKVLDVTHPGAAAYLQERIRTIVAAGIRLLKIDFLFGAAIEGQHYRPATGMQAYHQMMQLIREAAGPETILVGVGAPPLGTLPYVDSWRVGGDIAFSPGPLNLPPMFSFIANQARSIAGRYPFCRATLCDADPLLMRSPLSETDVKVASWVVALTGGGLFLSDNLPALADVRVDWGMPSLPVAASMSGHASTPLTFFPDHIPDELVSVKDFILVEHEVPSLWRLPSGERLGINFHFSEQKIDGTSVAGHTAVLLR